MAGDKIVPRYDDRPLFQKDNFNEAPASMKMTDCIDLLESKPTNYCIFLYNKMKEVPDSLIAREAIAFDNPDVNKCPAWQKTPGYIKNLNHGETRYMSGRY